MRAKLALFVSTALTCLTTGLHASSLVLNANGTITEAFQGVNPTNGTFSGTVTFDTATGQATAENITAYFNGTAGFSFAASSIPTVTAIPSFGTPASDYSYVSNGDTTVQVLDVFNQLNIHALDFTVSDALLTSYNGDPMINPGVLGQSTENIVTIGSGKLTDPNALPPAASTPGTVVPRPLGHRRRGSRWSRTPTLPEGITAPTQPRVPSLDVGFPSTARGAEKRTPPAKSR